MTDRYTGQIKCPYCNKWTEFYYASELMEFQTCDKCRKTFEIGLK